MKDVTLTVVAVLLLALAITLTFHWVYPRVTLSGELIGLFVFVAFVLKLVFSKLWSMRKKPGAKTGSKASS